MPLLTEIVTQDVLPDGFLGLLRVAFADDGEHDDERRAFFKEYPDSVHAVVYDGGTLVAHAAFITRTLYTARRAIETAYVEYVAAEPRRRGFGSAAMRELELEIRRRGYAFAALATGTPEFYESLGWRRWGGMAAYRKDGAVTPMPEEIIMVLDLGADADPNQQIECDWRPIGDIW
jgi:aminoglycoside 2'-N-acetyltransferase I